MNQSTRSVPTGRTFLHFVLSAFYLFLSLLGKKFLTHDRQKIIESILVFASILFWAYLLRRTLSAIAGNQDGLLALSILFFALIVAWFIPRIQIYRLNAMFLMLCLISVLSGLISIATTDLNGVAGSLESQSSQPDIRQVTFTRLPKSSEISHSPSKPRVFLPHSSGCCHALA